MSGSFLIELPDCEWIKRFSKFASVGVDMVIRWHTGYCVYFDVLEKWFELGLIDWETYSVSYFATAEEYERLS